MNPQGVRFGSAELYNICAFYPEIKDCLAVSTIFYNHKVGQRLKDGDERVILFIKIDSLTDTLIDSLKTKIRKELSARHVPSFIIKIADIPVVSISYI